MRQRLALILKVVLGLVFILSAILKVADMDKFELYIYSYHIFNLSASFIIARIAIIAELILGIGLIINRLHKPVWWGCVTMLVCYTLLMAYALILGRTDNCHCFGEVVEFNPWQTIIKNAVLLILFALIYKVKEKPLKRKVLTAAGIVIGCTAAVFVASPPDSFYYDSEPMYGYVEPNLLYYAIQNPPLDSLKLNEGRKMVGIFSASCDYCKIAAKKIGLMQEHNGFPEENIQYVFMGSEEQVKNFFIESESKKLPYIIYDDPIFLMKLTNGAIPLIILLDNGKIYKEYDFREVNEKVVKEFFENTSEP